MIRAAAVGVLALVVAGCAQTPPVPTARPILPTPSPVAASTAQTAVASPTGTVPDLAWSPLVESSSWSPGSRRRSDDRPRQAPEPRTARRSGETRHHAAV